MISLIKLLREVLVDEGGNVFGTTSSIKKEYILPTLDLFTKELKRLYPKVNFKFESLGSVGKKDESGDIDLGMSIDNFIDSKNNQCSYGLYRDWETDRKSVV